MTPNQFRKIALGLDGVIEKSHMDHPDFRAANGKIYATLTKGEDRACVMLTPEQQAVFLRDAPKVFEPAAGAWGRGGSTLIALKIADPEMVGEAVTLAWQNKNAAPAKKSAKKKAAKKRR